MNCGKLYEDVWMISPITQNVKPRISVRRRPSKSPMKIVAMAETIHPKCHVPTVRPDCVNGYPGFLQLCRYVYRRTELLRHTCDPSIVERIVVDNINLWKVIQELLNGQETAHHTLGIPETSASELAHTINLRDAPRPMCPTHKKQSPQVTLIALAKLLPRSPKKRAIAWEMY